MKCRECGAELNAHDPLQNGAYRCPECGTLHQALSSSAQSNSTQHSVRKRQSVLLWIWVAIALVVLIAAVLLLFTQRNAVPEPASDGTAEEEFAEDAFADDGADPPNGGWQIPEATSDDALPADFDPFSYIPMGSTKLDLEGFMSCFDSLMEELNYTSSLNLVMEDAGFTGEIIQTYTYEDWLEVMLSIDPDTTMVQDVVVMALVEPTEESEERMFSAFSIVLRCFDDTLDAEAGTEKLHDMLNDGTHMYETDSFLAMFVNSDFSGYMLEVSGKLL